ncbi:MAG: NAD(P)-dependent oxidoreductase [Chitinophagales bacterium]|nr:NAD(P)-dependent oxidoreductase [Chitinophagales bacterium]
MKSYNKKAIVIGGSGYIGSNLEFYLRKMGGDVDSYDRRSKINFFDSNEIKQINFNSADLIFFMAGKTGTIDGFDEYEEYIKSNEILLLKTLQEIIKQGFSGRFVYPSTRLIYKGIEKTPLKENDQKETKTIYAANKLFAENVINSWSNYYGLNYTIYRICVPYGHIIENKYSYGTMGFLTNQAKKDKKITLFGNGEIYRTFTHVEDICKIMTEASLIESTKNEIYNIGSNDNISLKSLAEMISIKYNAEICFVPWKESFLKLESGDTIFDDSKLKRIMKIDYKNSLKNYIGNL